jgi:hypothetical protein
MVQRHSEIFLQGELPGTACQMRHYSNSCRPTATMGKSTWEGVFDVVMVFYRKNKIFSRHLQRTVNNLFDIR